MYRHLAALILCLGLCPLAEAATLIKVKGQQVLIDLQGEGSNYAKGDRYIVMSGGKRLAVVEIVNVKGNRAIGKVLKGNAVEQGTLAPLPGASGGGSGGGGGGGGGSAKQASSSAGRSSRSRRRHGGMFDNLSWGALVGYNMNTQTVTVGTESVAMAGSGFSLKAFADYPISDRFGAMGRLGLEQFSVKGTSISRGDVNTSITYLDADLLFRYNLLDQPKMKVFPLVGAGLFYPLSKTSGVLDVQRISATTIFFLGAGIHYAIKDTMYIHATAEYGLFPPSNDVKTSMIAVRGGVGWAL